MANLNRLKSSGSGSSKGRRNRNTYITKSGQSIKLNRNLSQKMKGWRDSWHQHKAVRLAGMPKTRLKRFLFRLKPANLYHYWFSREGAIMALKVFGIGVVVIFILLVGAFAYLRKDLPAINSIYGQNLGGSITYYDSTGNTVLWQDYNAVKRVPVPGNQISTYMKDATVSIEDKNFYHEGAFDVGAILRSAYHDVFSSGGGLYGGSTITQQLVKLNENWTDNRTILRKIKEVILASELEREYSKDDILTGYLNIAPYGGVDYGVETAAQDYFHLNASQLDLAQSAFLAAIPQSPDYYSPNSPDFNEPALIGREEYILDQMQKQGYITAAQNQTAKNENVLAEVQPQQSLYAGIQAPYFVLAAKQQLNAEYGASTVDRGGWKVITTLNLTQEHQAETLVANNLPNVERYDGDEEAVVVENVPTGQVTALVGGVDFNNPDYGQINYATTEINPGSSYKLYDYTALINDNNNVGAGSVLYDIQQTLPGYPCTDKSIPKQGGNCLEDYDFRYPGAETLRYALAGSRNVPAVKAMLINGESKTIGLSEQMGLVSGYNCYNPGSDVNDPSNPTIPCYGSAAIGDGAYLRLNEHVNGFATDSRLGQYLPQTFIKQINDSSGKLVYKWTPPKPVQVVKPDAAYIVDNMISDPRASYLPGSCTATNCTSLSQGGYKFQRSDGWDVAVKTGTTNENYDGLMMAMTTQYAVGTWVGYHTDTRALVSGGMEYLTEPLARGMINDLTAGQKPINWVQPSDIKTLPAYVVTTHIGLGSEEPSPSTDLFPSWYNPPNQSNKSYTIDIVSNDLATDCTPQLAKKTVGSSYDSNIFSVDTFVNSPGSGSSYSTTQSDSIHQCGDQLPTISISSNPSPPLSCNGTVCTIGVIDVAQGTHPLTDAQFPMQINAIVDGQTIPVSCSSYSPPLDPNNSPSASEGQTCSFPYTGSGQHSVQFQVIDSVLYASTSSATTINIPSITSPSNNSTFGKNSSITFSWTSTGSNSYTVQLNGNNYCTAGGGSTSCNGGGLSPGSYTARVTDNSDQDTSPPITITISGS